MGRPPQSAGLCHVERVTALPLFGLKLPLEPGSASIRANVTCPIVVIWRRGGLPPWTAETFTFRAHPRLEAKIRGDQQPRRSPSPRKEKPYDPRH